MSELENLKWSDIKSQTMTIKEYLETLENKHGTYENYGNYIPKAEIIEKIKKKLFSIENNLKILAIGASWCPDCSKNVPRMIKILEKISLDKIHLEILYGVMVNALRKRGDPYWHKTRSPPEAMNPKFNLEKIPTFFFFLDDKYIGRVVERPIKFPTLEEEILHIIEKI